MAVRVDAIPNQVADILERKLQLIDSRLDATRWLTSPLVKRRGTLGEALICEKPALILQVDSLSDVPGVAVGRHEAELRVLIHCVTEGFDASAEKLLLRLAADVMEVLAESEYPVTDQGVQILTFGRMDFRLSTEATDTSGIGIGTLQVPVFYTWLHGAP